MIKIFLNSRLYSDFCVPLSNICKCLTGYELYCMFLVFPQTIYLHAVRYANFVCFTTMKSFQNGLCLLDVVTKQRKALKLTFSSVAKCSKIRHWIAELDIEFNFPIPTTASAAC